MTGTANLSRSRRRATTGGGGRRPQRFGPLPAAAVVAGVCLALLVGRDGTPVWQALRVLLVVGGTAAAVQGLRRPGTWARGLTGFSAGLAATAVGVGIGPAHLGKAGWTTVTLAGLVCLAAGLVLLGGGGTLCVRAARGWRRLVVVPVCLFAVYLAGWCGGQAVAATNVPPTALGVLTPAALGLPFIDVRFPTTDGVDLSGWYIPSRTGAAVVLRHGAGSTRSNVLDHAAVLARHGYGVLLADARGHGNSGGRAMDLGWYGDLDVAAGVTYLASRPDVDGRRIALVGMSMGGEEALGALAGDSRVRAVVAEGATGRGVADKAWLADRFGWRGRLQQRVDWITFATTDLLTGAKQPAALRDAVAAAERPVLLITAGAVPTETWAGRYIESGSPETVELWEAPDAGHTRALATYPGEWERRVTVFLADALVPVAG